MKGTDTPDSVTLYRQHEQLVRSEFALAAYRGEVARTRQRRKVQAKRRRWVGVGLASHLCFSAIYLTGLYLWTHSLFFFTGNLIGQDITVALLWLTLSIRARRKYPLE